MKTLRNYINGQWVEPENAGCLDVENPSTAEIHCDIKMQGKSAFEFFTHRKVIVERYWPED